VLTIVLNDEESHDQPACGKRKSQREQHRNLDRGIHRGYQSEVAMPGRRELPGSAPSQRHLERRERDEPASLLGPGVTMLLIGERSKLTLWRKPLHSGYTRLGVHESSAMTAPRAIMWLPSLPANHGWILIRLEPIRSIGCREPSNRTGPCI
jgi:hypothetical protein